MARLAIDCYVNQSHPSKQLVILCDGIETFVDLRAYTSALARDDIHITHVEEGSLSLGALRNKTLELASNRYVCQWDDDDLYHSQRISLQLEAMLAAGAEVSFLTDQLHLLYDARRVYWCDWAQSRRSPWPAAIPNTVMCPRNMSVRYPSEGRYSIRAEDEVFMNGLVREHHAVGLHGLGLVYLYVCHGNNTWPDAHHRGIIRATAMCLSSLEERRDQLDRFLRQYRLPWPASIRDDHDVEVCIIPTSRCFESARDIVRTC
jgi:glycosyltransferase involved in cell wall biosynthesis